MSMIWVTGLKELAKMSGLHRFCRIANMVRKLFIAVELGDLITPKGLIKTGFRQNKTFVLQSIISTSLFSKPDVP